MQQCALTCHVLLFQSLQFVQLDLDGLQRVVVDIVVRRHEPSGLRVVVAKAGTK